MSFYEKIKNNLSVQLYELEALQSVYPKELIIGDHGTLADINNFIDNPQDDLPQGLEYSIQISVEHGTIELQVMLPTDYPEKVPEVYARSPLLDRTQQMLLNEVLTTYVDSQEKGEACIYAVISWIQDNADKYLLSSKISAEHKVSNSKKVQNKHEKLVFARYWIYSHHIYGKFKRRDIIVLAKENSLTGFSLAGKPGIICIEGDINDCDYYWQQVKSMNWHRILIKFMEKETMNSNEDIQSMRKFTDFQEVCFPSSERHNDMGLVLKYLKEHESQHVFKELFGIEGKVIDE